MSRAEIHLPGGPAGVVLIHGLTGSPFELKFLAGQLNRVGFTVSVPCLAGHDGDIVALKKTTWRDWYATVEKSIAALRGQGCEVFLAGLCMGAVLALHAAHEYGNAVRAVAAMSTTFRFDGWSIPWYRFLIPLNNYTPLRHLYSYPEGEPFGIKNPRLRRSVAKGLKDNTLAYDCVPGVSMYQLHQLARQVIPELPDIKTPTIVLHSGEDDTAGIGNANLVLERIGARHVRSVTLDDCYHMITIDNQRDIVAEEVTAFFRGFSSRIS